MLPLTPLPVAGRTCGLAAACLVAGALAAGCAAHPPAAPSARPLERGARWAVLPLLNHSETPQAGERAEALAAALLRERGVSSVETWPGNDSPALAAFDDRARLDHALRWARAEGVRYGLTGEVVEWRYRPGPDGEPAVGLALRIIDLEDGRVVYATSGSRSGWGWKPLASVAQSLVEELLDGVELR